MRVILVPVADRPECAKALRVAFELARQLNANVCGCHIRPHRGSRVALPMELASLADYEAVWEAADRGKQTAQRNAAARALFGKVSDKHGYPLINRPTSAPGAVWLEKVGSPDKVLSIMGPVSDLLIVSRPKAKGGKIARLFLLAALLNSSRPVLVLPQNGKSPVGKRISIAWNQSAEAARAVAAAMPLLQNAEQVNIISVGPESGLGPKASQLATYLKFWGVKSKRVAAPRAADASEGLIKGYHDTRSDLLVMGAYSRNRLRQRIFGGVTEFMLHKAKIPVLMLHT